MKKVAGLLWGDWVRSDHAMKMTLSTESIREQHRRFWDSHEGQAAGQGTQAGATHCPGTSDSQERGTSPNLSGFFFLGFRQEKNSS